MKKVLCAILFAGIVAGPVFSAETASSVAVMAKAGSKVSIDKLSLAVYEVVKAEPSKAVDVFCAVMAQREKWSVTDAYAILRAVLLAAPELEVSFVQAASVHQGGAYDTRVVGSSGYQLLTSLYAMPQVQAVADAVVQGVVGSSKIMRPTRVGVPQKVLDAYAYPTTPAPVDPEYPVTPTPPPTSSNN